MEEVIMAGDEISTAESLRKTRTYGRFRCHNPSCMGRLQPDELAGEPSPAVYGPTFVAIYRIANYIPMGTTSQHNRRDLRSGKLISLDRNIIASND